MIFIVSHTYFLTVPASLPRQISFIPTSMMNLSDLSNRSVIFLSFAFIQELIASQILRENRHIRAILFTLSSLGPKYHCAVKQCPRKQTSDLDLKYSLLDTTVNLFKRFL